MSRANGRPVLLWVGAHPDDEIFAAPLLGRLCVRQRYRCTFLVFTRGERGICRKATGCGDLSRTRAEELRQSAAIFGARVVQWQYPDGTRPEPEAVIGKWAAGVGCARLTDDLRAAMEGADIVLTFDASHGSSRHADHRAVGTLVRMAVAGMPRPPVLYCVQNRAEVTRGGSQIAFAPSPSASAESLVSSTRDWSYVLHVAREHQSQFDADALAGFANTRESARVVVAGRCTPSAGPLLCAR